MNTTILFIVIAIVCLLIGFVIGKILTKNKLEKRTSELEIRNKLLLEDKESNILILKLLNEDKTNLIN